MRYIPETGRQFVLQVPEDKNSYINVKNYDARGLATIFSGSLLSSNESEISIGNITDSEDGTLQQYLPVLSSGVELQAYIYRGAGSASIDTPIITETNVTPTGIDFSSTSTTSTVVQPLKYYIFGYNAETGYMPNAVRIIGGSGEYSKVLDPDKWNEDQYFEITFSKAGQYVIPIIYRVWGSRVDFLGAIGNGKTGFPGASVISFRDYGLKEIPSWNNDPAEWTPDFLEGVISVQGGVPTQIRKIVGKEHLKIKPRIEGTQPNYINCQAATASSIVRNEEYQFNDEVRFIIDDTQAIRNAINLAASGNIKEVFFPAGTYYIRNSSFLTDANNNYSNISLRGVGEGSVLKRVPSSINGSINPGLFNFTGQSESPRIEGIRFRNIVFDGNKSSNVSLIGPASGSIDPSRYVNEDLLFLKNADNIAISECRFINAGGSGVHIESSSGIILVNSIFSKIGRSYEQENRVISVYETSNSIVQGNIFEFSTSGPYFFSVDFSTINNNIVRSCGDQGIVLETSYQWNAGGNAAYSGNLAYSDTDSLIRSVDQYNNEYSKAPIEIRRGSPLEPIYFTVTNGGESIGIKKDTIIADIYKLNVAGQKDVANKLGSFKVVQTSDQLEAGIFSVTLPGITSTTIDGNTVPATSDFALLDPALGEYGYMYEIYGTVNLGQSGRGYVPVNVRDFSKGGVSYLAVQLRNSSELLSFLIFDSSNPENDSIIIEGFSNTNLGGWDQNKAYAVVDIDIDSNSLLINPIPSLSPGEDGIDFLGGQLYIQRSNYQIADGNIIVH
jgi:hypothetical protein